MTEVRSHKPIPLGLTALVALAAALAALAVSGDHGAQAHGPASTHAAVTSAELGLRQDMRKLWEDHITWTRMVIVDFAAGASDMPAAEKRLLRNQVDIGNAIKPYYGQCSR